MPEPVIIAEGVAKRYGTHAVLDGLAVALRPGSVFGLVGLNGVGKTTLIRLLLGLIRPQSGLIRVFGSDPWLHRTGMYRRLGVVLEHEGFWGNLTFAQNFDLFARAKGVEPEAAAGYLRDHWSGQEIVASRKKVREFSRGQRVQCGLCRAFLGKPRALLLDEPTTALDVRAYEHFCGLVRSARQDGAAVLISSHNLGAIEELCDSVGLLQNGVISLLEGSADASGACWMIAVDRADGDDAIVGRAAVGDTSYENGAWHVRVREPEREIPEIVRALVLAGRSVREVRAEETDLRAVVRKMYS